MPKPQKTQFILAIVMLISFLACIPLQPSKFYKDDHPFDSLDNLVPDKFADWQSVDQQNGGSVIDPSSTTLINQIYNQTLSRIYINRKTQKNIMLSIAYGEDQSDSRELHIPDACYPAQGFQLGNKEDIVLKTGLGDLKARRMVAYQSGRVEPLTYWIILSDNQVRKGYDSKLTQLKLGMRGYIPDGFIVRVSTINDNAVEAYQTEESFINEFINSLGPSQLMRLAGLKSSASNNS
jgi:EpsI family protein